VAHNLGFQPLVGGEHRDIALVFPVLVPEFEDQLSLFQISPYDEIGGDHNVDYKTQHAYVPGSNNDHTSEIPGMAHYLVNSRDDECALLGEGPALSSGFHLLYPEEIEYAVTPTACDEQEDTHCYQKILNNQQRPMPAEDRFRLQGGGIVEQRNEG